MPAWLTQFLDREERVAAELASLRAQLERRLDEIRALHRRVETIAGARDAAREKVKQLQFDLRLARMEKRANRMNRERLFEMFGGRGQTPSVDSEVYRRLAKKYHPDLNPAHAEVMSDINELMQSLKRR